MTPQHAGESNKDVLRSPHHVIVAAIAFSGFQPVNRIYGTAKTCQNRVMINLIKKIQGETPESHGTILGNYL